MANLRCQQCRKPCSELYPLGGKDYCAECVPSEYRKLYKDWKPKK